MVPQCCMLCLYVYGLQQYGLLNNSYPSCFLFCSVLYQRRHVINIFRGAPEDFFLDDSEMHPDF